MCDTDIQTETETETESRNCTLSLAHASSGNYENVDLGQEMLKWDVSPGSAHVVARVHVVLQQERSV